MLAGWVADLGVDVRRGQEVLGLAQDRGGVDVDVAGPAGPLRLRAAYVVGCDGGRSTVRRAAGFEFPGTAATIEMFLADIRGVELRPRMIGETSPGGIVMAGHLGDGVERLIVCERGTPPRKRTAPGAWKEIPDAWDSLTAHHTHPPAPLYPSSFRDA